MIARIGFVCLSLLVALSGDSGATAAPPPACAEVTVILVRHAETASATGGGRDPDLSPAGVARAEALARALGDAGVTHLFASEFKRTRQTLEPLARRRGLEIAVVTAREIERQVHALRELPAGSVAVVAGHSDTVPALAAALGAPLSGLVDDPDHGPLLPHDEFDRLIVVIPAPEDGCAARVLELRYGP